MRTLTVAVGILVVIVTSYFFANRATAQISHNAVAFVHSVHRVEAANGSDLFVCYFVSYAGPDVNAAGGPFIGFEACITITPLDSALTIRVKLTNAVQTLATTFGFTVAGADILLPEIQRGL
jgi:hypothetical protein